MKACSGTRVARVFKSIEQCVGSRGIVAHKHHVASRFERGTTGRDHVACDARAFHRQVVAEDRAFESEAATKDVLQPNRGEARRFAVHSGIDHVRRHHRRERRSEPRIGRRIVREDGFEIAIVAGDRHMRIGSDVAMAGKMLPAIRHSREQQAVQQALRQQAHDARVAMKRPVADHGTGAVVKIEHRCKRQIDSTRHKICGEDETDRGRRARRNQCPVLCIAVPQRAEAAHRRQPHEAIASKSLHAAALMIDSDQKSGTDRANRFDQCAELCAALEVAREQDHAASPPVGDAATVAVGQRRRCDVEHHGAQGSLVHRCIHLVRAGSTRSTTANATA